MHNLEYNSSNWTGRTPRTLEQAFGPYHSGSSFLEKVHTMSFWGMVGYVIILAFVLLFAHITAIILTTGF